MNSRNNADQLHYISLSDSPVVIVQIMLSSFILQILLLYCTSSWYSLWVPFVRGSLLEVALPVGPWVQWAVEGRKSFNSDVGTSTSFNRGGRGVALFVVLTTRTVMERNNNSTTYLQRIRFSRWPRPWKDVWIQSDSPVADKGATTFYLHAMDKQE